MSAKRGKRGPGKASGPGPARRSGESEREGKAEAPGPDRLLRLSPRRLGFLGLAAGSGVLWFLACASFDIWPLAWLAMAPGLWVIERASTRKRAALFGWLIGTVANLGGFYWVNNLLTRFGHLPTPVAWLGLLLLCSYQGVVFLLFASVVRRVREVSAERLGAPLPMALVAPLVMVTFEILVPFIFPWYLAITQAWVTPVIQIAELTGPVGVTALLLAVNGALYDAFHEQTRRRRILPAVGAGLALAAALVFGVVRMHQVDAARADATKLKVGVVQGNIPFDMKGINRHDLAHDQLEALQAKSAELERAGAQLLMWTESSYPYHVPRDQPDDFPEASEGRIRRGFTVPLILGAVTTTADYPSKPPYNSALMLDGAGHFTGRFDKIFLLVFGEYIPFYDSLPFIRKLMPSTAGQFTRGKDVVAFPFALGGKDYRLAPLICYEDILADFGRRLAALHPHLLVNITNDAWFGDTSEPWEHLALSVYRAVELRVDLVRAVNTGVSAFVDANGRVFAKTYAVDPKNDPRGVDGLVAEVALVEGGHTVYAAVGNLFGYLCAAVTGFLWLAWPRLRRRSRLPPAS